MNCLIEAITNAWNSQWKPYEIHCSLNASMPLDILILTAISYVHTNMEKQEQFVSQTQPQKAKYNGFILFHHSVILLYNFFGNSFKCPTVMFWCFSKNLSNQNNPWLFSNVHDISIFFCTLNWSSHTFTLNIFVQFQIIWSSLHIWNCARWIFLSNRNRCIRLA